MKKLLILSLFLLTLRLAGFAEIESETAYKISSYYSPTKSLSIENSTLDRKGGIVLWTETNVPAQRWLATKAVDNFFFLTNAYSEQTIRYGSQRAKPNTAIFQELNVTTAFFQWEFVPVAGTRYPEGYFIRFSMKTDDNEYLYLEPADDTEGAKVFVQLKKADNDSIRQIWRMTPVEPVVNKLTPYVREEMMKGWKDRYYNALKTSKGFWGEAEMLETILDAYETTGKSEYKTMFEEVYEHFVSSPGGWYEDGNGQDWRWNDFNDDIAWAVLASVRAYLMFETHPKSNINYLTIAKNNYDWMYSRALLPSGMLRWKESNPNNSGSNSCINGPAEIAACYLAIATGDDSYYEKAKNLYALQRKHLYDPATGKVFDSGSWNGDVFTVGNHWVSTYNQGTFLGAALMLYNHYGDEQYKQDALKIVEWTRKDLCNTHGVIRVCGSGDDLQGFKGILMRYLRRYIVDLAIPKSGDWLQRNALHAFNNRNSKGISWTAWWEKSAENFIFSDGYDYSNKSFGASTAVSAAFNAPLDTSMIIKKAFSTIEAECFDYIKGIYVKTDESGEITAVENIKNNYYTAYNNVDFSAKQVKEAIFQVLPARKAATIEIRLGSPSGQLIGTANIPSGDSWTTVTCEVEEVTGRQNIYLVYQGSGFKVDSFRFSDGITGITQLPDALLNMEIFPNPVVTDLNIKIPQAGYLMIYDSIGRQLFSKNVPFGVFSLNVDNYIPGIYFVSLITNEGKSSIQFLKK